MNTPTSRPSSRATTRPPTRHCAGASQPTARGRCGQVVWDPTLGARPSYAGWHANAKRSNDKIDVHDNGFLTPRSTASSDCPRRPARPGKAPDALHYCSRRTIHWFDCGRWARPRLAFGRKNGTVFGLRRGTGRTRGAAPRGCRSNKQTVQGFAADFACEFTDGARVTAVKETSVVLAEARTSLD